MSAYYNSKDVSFSVDVTGLVNIDEELSLDSENPVQNKVVTQALNDVKINIDEELSLDSENPVQNKVVTQALNDVKINIDEELSLDSENPVQNKVITNEFNKIPIKKVEPLVLEEVYDGLYITKHVKSNGKTFSSAEPIIALVTLGLTPTSEDSEDLMPIATIISAEEGIFNYGGGVRYPYFDNRIESNLFNAPTTEAVKKYVDAHSGYDGDLAIYKLGIQEEPIDIFSLADGMYIGSPQNVIKVTDDFSIIALLPYNFIVTTEKGDNYTTKLVAFYGIVGDDNYENMYTTAILQLYADESGEWQYEFEGVPYTEGGSSQPSWKKIIDVTVDENTNGVGTNTIKFPLDDLSTKNANRFVLLVEPYTTESKALNSMSINAYIRPETGTYYSFLIYNAPSNNAATKANSLNYGMSSGDIIDNGTSDAIAMVTTHGITQYSNPNSDTGNTRFGTYSFNASRINSNYAPYLHLVANGYTWEVGSKVKLCIM